MDTRRRNYDSSQEWSDGSRIPFSNKRRKRGAFDGIGSVPSHINGSTSVNPDSPDLFFVYDRRMKSDIFQSEQSLYSLLRAWVHDDPNRKVPQINIKGSKIEFSVTVFDPVLSHLLEKLNAPTTSHDIENFRDIINSLDSIPHKDFITQHVAHFKQIKRIWRQVAAIRYFQCRDHLDNKSIPRHEGMEKILADSSDRGIQALFSRLSS